MSKIIKLNAENVKRLQAVEIKPDGNVVVIGGKNGAGKSSVLDAIQYALGGEPSDAMPVRRGEEKAVVVVDLGDLVVKRTCTASGGGSLTVTNADGVKQMSPQSILDKLTGRLTFDPLEFARQKPDKQADTLRGLVGLDFKDHDAERQRLFDERTLVNRDARQLEARLKAMPKHEDAPEAEQSTAAILEEQRNAAAINATNARVRSEAHAAEEAVAALKTKAEAIENDIARLKGELAAVNNELKKQAPQSEALAKKAAEVSDIDLEPFQSRATSAEQANRKFRENAQRNTVVQQFKAKTAEADKLTASIEAMDSKKRKAITEAKYPITGLMFDTAGGVTLGGIPFSQCSAAEQLKVSVAIGLALNPKLRVLLIRDGSLLDEESMTAVLEMAKKADAQVWIERVGDGDATAVIIEDGLILN